MTEKKGYLERMSDTELTKEFSSYWYMIHGEEGCYGTKDLYMLQAIEEELLERGFTQVVKAPEWKKYERDEEERECTLCGLVHDGGCTIMSEPPKAG